MASLAFEIAGKSVTLEETSDRFQRDVLKALHQIYDAKLKHIVCGRHPNRKQPVITLKSPSLEELSRCPAYSVAGCCQSVITRCEDALLG